MVTEVVPGDQLRERGRASVAAIIASQPQARDRRHRARDLGRARVRQRAGRPPRLRVRRAWAPTRTPSPRARSCSRRASASSGSCAERGTKRVAIVGAALSDSGGSTQDAVRAALPGRVARDRRRRPHQGRHRRLRLERHGLLAPVEVAEYLRAAARPGSTAPASAAATWEFMVEHAAAAIQAGHVETVVLVVRLDDARRPQGAAPQRQPRVRRPRPGAVRRAVRPHAHLEVRDGDAPPHVRVRHHDRAARRDRGVDALQRRRSTPRRTTATRSRSTTCRAPR